MKRPVDRYVESLLRRRRPKPFAPTHDDLAITRTAIDLAAAAPDARRPSDTFVEDLRRRLAAQAATAPSLEPAGSDRSRTTARRRLLTAGALTATAAAGVVAGHALTHPASEPSSDAQNELTPTTGTWHNVAADVDLPDGGVLPFDLGAVTGFVRRASGRIQAVSGFCTHQGCRLALTPPRDKLACPCHGATFTLAGAPLTHPHNNQPLSALPRLPVRVQQGQIQIYAPAIRA